MPLDQGDLTRTRNRGPQFSRVSVCRLSPSLSLFSVVHGNSVERSC